MARYWLINTAATAVPLSAHPSPLVINEISGGHIWRSVVRRRCSTGPVLLLWVYCGKVFCENCINRDKTRNLSEWWCLRVATTTCSTGTCSTQCGWSLLPSCLSATVTLCPTLTVDEPLLSARASWYVSLCVCLSVCLSVYQELPRTFPFQPDWFHRLLWLLYSFADCLIHPAKEVSNRAC